ncbi:uncharacterized protein LOC125240017 [Leguminivora glycinivorella]|uniref:uncharacterized protein LOC125240017 n=1 Tax=Leguminivora glycinivorella TaxID=1035111 RepID=UPI00200D99D6|nr:uncharacterized protein LOC125240017 [Leguminivora glycinivorella]
MDLHCSCCLLRRPERGLATLYNHNGRTEVYSDMLRECFDINLISTYDKYGICEVCVGRLRDASDFKLQVKCCQEKLHQCLQREFSDTDKIEEIILKDKLQIASIYGGAPTPAPADADICDSQNRPHIPATLRIHATSARNHLTTNQGSKFTVEYTQEKNRTRAMYVIKNSHKKAT